MENIYVWKIKDDMTLEFVEMIELFDTLIWTTRYYTNGEFELYVHDDKLMKYIGNNHVVSLDINATKLMFIEKGSVTQDENRKVTYKLSGRCLLSLLDRRVLGKKRDIHGELTTEQLLVNLISSNITGSGVPSKRKIPRLKISSPQQSITDAITTTLTIDSLLNITSKLCEDVGIGQKIERKSDGSLVYTVLQSKDKPVVFSSDLDNLASFEFLKNTTGIANAVYIQDDNDMVQNVEQYPIKEGVNRFERVIICKYQRSDFTTESDFQKSLHKDAEHQMLTSVTNDFQCEVYPNITYTYGKDYNVGNIVKVIGDRVKAKVRIIEAIESWDNSGYRVVLTFEILEVIEWL